MSNLTRVESSIQRMKDVKDHFDIMTQFVRDQLKKGHDYGNIPGCDRPALFKPGAEKLVGLFNLYPSEFEPLTVIEDFTGEHHKGEAFFHYRYRCVLRRIEDDKQMGVGIGSCNSWESKYRWRKAERVCPECGAAAIKKSKFPPKNNPSAKPGWYCFSKLEGCGVNFDADDPRITKQEEGQKPNDDIFSQINTLDKMAQKRAFIAAVIVATKASEFFTQDIEDLYQVSIRNLIQEIKEEMERVGWNKDTTRAHLSQMFPYSYQGDIKALSVEELQQFYNYLQSLEPAIEAEVVSSSNVVDMPQAKTEPTPQPKARKVTAKASDETETTVDPFMEKVKVARKAVGITPAQIKAYLAETFQKSTPAELDDLQRQKLMQWINSKANTVEAQFNQAKQEQ